MLVIRGASEFPLLTRHSRGQGLNMGMAVLTGIIIVFLGKAWRRRNVGLFLAALLLIVGGQGALTYRIALDAFLPSRAVTGRVDRLYAVARGERPPGRYAVVNGQTYFVDGKNFLLLHVGEDIRGRASAEFHTLQDVRVVSPAPAGTP